MNMARMLVAALAGSLFVSAMAAQPVAANGAPTGFLLMCMAHPEECRSGGAPRVTASDEVLTTIRTINTAINTRIRPAPDAAGDVWSIDVTSGDCEDYVLAKRKALIRAGLPAASLRIAAVTTRRGEGHAVLVVNTSRGRIVLDNLTSAIRPLAQTGYRIVSIQTANPYEWS